MVDAVTELVETAKHDETTPRDSQGIKHLTSGQFPSVDFTHLIPFWIEEPNDAGASAFHSATGVGVEVGFNHGANKGQLLIRRGVLIGQNG